MNISEQLTRFSRPCSCGKTHTLITDSVYIGADAHKHLSDDIRRRGFVHGVVVADTNTAPIAGEALANALALPLIVDGKIHNGHLKLLGRDENWLKARLREQKTDMNEVFIAVSDGSTLTIFAKEKKK